MTNESKLIFIKILHTVIWAFYGSAIFYFLYAVIVNKIDPLLWTCVLLTGIEILTLIIFKFTCPLTIIARRYSDSKKDNFDIYLPNWLAKYNKFIFGIIIGVALIILVYRLITNA